MMLTARAELQDRLEGLAHGADDYLAKPFARRELRTRVENLITRRRQLREKVRLSGFQRLAEVTATPLDEAFLERAVEVVRARLDDPELTVVALASELSMSPRSLRRKLDAVAGINPKAFLNTIRLERARHLLQNDQGNVSEIAFAVGFSDASVFSRTFSAHFGFPPSVIKKQRDSARRPAAMD